MPRKTVHSEFKIRLGINGKSHIDWFLGNKKPKKDMISFSSLVDGVEKVKKKIKKGYGYPDFLENLEKSENPMGGFTNWQSHLDAGIALIVEKATTSKELDIADYKQFRRHIEDAINEISRANENYRRTQAFLPADHEYAVGVINTLKTILKKPEVYMNLIYLHAKYGEVRPEHIEENKKYLLTKKKLEKR